MPGGWSPRDCINYIVYQCHISRYIIIKCLNEMYIFRRMWKKLSAVKSGTGGHGGLLANAVKYVDDSEEEFNEETKWSWYIS